MKSFILFLVSTLTFSTLHCRRMLRYEPFLASHLLDHISFQQYSDKPVKNRLILPKDNPGYFGLNEPNDLFMFRYYYITKKLDAKTIQEVVKSYEGKPAIGFVPLKLTETQQLLEKYGYTKHKEDAGDRIRLMKLEITHKYIKKLLEEKANKSIRVVRVKDRQGYLTWAKTAVNAFKDMWKFSEKQIQAWIKFVVDNAYQNATNVYFYIGYYEGKAVTVCQVVYNRNEQEQFAYCSWGGTQKEYRKKGVLRAVWKQGILDASKAGIKVGFSMAQPNKANLEVHKKLGFENTGNEWYWYAYDPKSFYSKNQKPPYSCDIPMITP